MNESKPPIDSVYHKQYSPPQEFGPGWENFSTLSDRVARLEQKVNDYDQLKTNFVKLQTWVLVGKIAAPFVVGAIFYVFYLIFEKIGIPL